MPSTTTTVIRYPDGTEITVATTVPDGPPLVVYAAAHCYGAPIPDERAPTMNVLALSADGSELKLIQSVEMPSGTLMPVSQKITADKARLFSTAGTNGVVAFELDPSDQGKILTAKLPVCSAVTPEPLETPYGVMPVDVALDTKGEVAFTCNFLMGTISALTVDVQAGTLSAPQVSTPCDPRKPPGIPEKVQKIGPSSAAKALGFPEGFPEDSPHPHGCVVDPSGSWLVMGCLGTNHLFVYSLPVAESFLTGAPDFVLDGTHPDDSNRHDGGGPRSLVFSSDGKTLYSVQELDHTVAAYSFDSGSGSLTTVGSKQLTVPQAWLDSIPPRPHMYNAQPNYNSGIAISPDGKHVYTTGRGHDSVAGFAVSAADGSLTPTAQGNVGSGGRTPWALSFASPTLLVVTNQYADDPSAREGGGPDADPDRIAPLKEGDGNVTVFRRNVEDGSLTATGAIWEAPHVLSVIAP
jgi:6-phosphogluconolactonase (cycloisomerase 2 family)